MIIFVKTISFETWANDTIENLGLKIQDKEDVLFLTL